MDIVRVILNMCIVLNPLCPELFHFYYCLYDKYFFFFTNVGILMPVMVFDMK